MKKTQVFECFIDAITVIIQGNTQGITFKNI